LPGERRRERDGDDLVYGEGGPEKNPCLFRRRKKKAEKAVEFRNWEARTIGQSKKKSNSFRQKKKKENKEGAAKKAPLLGAFAEKLNKKKGGGRADAALSFGTGEKKMTREKRAPPPSISTKEKKKRIGLLRFGGAVPAQGRKKKRGEKEGAPCSKHKERGDCPSSCVDELRGESGREFRFRTSTQEGGPSQGGKRELQQQLSIIKREREE